MMRMARRMALSLVSSSNYYTLFVVLFFGIVKQQATGFSIDGRRNYNEAHLSRREGLNQRTTRLSSSSNENSSFSLTNSLGRLPERIQHRDVVIVGAGLAGLSAALYITQMDPSRHVTILDRLDAQVGRGGKSAVGSFAAAGMLAPQSERLPAGHLLDLCLDSRRMYTDFCDLVERLAAEAGEEGQKYFIQNDNKNNILEPWSVGYMATGGFLAPAFAGDSVATWAPPSADGSSSSSSSSSAVWLDATQARELEPNLHPSVVGGWWFPQDASVDALRLTCSLRAACVQAGVQILAGPDYEITSLNLADDTCKGMWIRKKGQYIAAKAVLVANGAWMRDLLPVPIEPHKGQSLSLKMPADRPPILRRVLFAQDSYIVPKADGTIVIGATVEAGSYDPNVTPAGLMHILTHALQLLPALKDLPIVETWAGLRPTTPDKGPILGKTLWNNLYVAGGYWRNGVLLAPKTGQLIASLITGQTLSKHDAELLQAFSWNRFTDANAGIALAANARYAASMHPVHQRTSGFGVAASVGTELGSYSTARSAAEERQRDRNFLFNTNNNDKNDDALERAAAQGKLDSTAYIFGNEGDAKLPTKKNDWASLLESSQTKTIPFEGSADAFTVGAAIRSKENSSNSSTSSSTTTNPLEDVYKTIRQNKAKRDEQLAAEGEDSSQQNDDDDDDEKKEDPGFRIYYEDPDTGEALEVPPYTSPGEFFMSLEEKKRAQDANTNGAIRAPKTTTTTTTPPQPSKTGDGYSEKTYDGYQDIQEANSRQSRQEELEAMRAARRSNRQGQSSLDLSKIGVFPMDNMKE